MGDGIIKTLFKNGIIIDGSGRPAYPGSVIISGSSIVEIAAGDYCSDFEGIIIDCKGLIVAPGFIDSHSHNDWFAASSNPVPYFKTFAEQGITSQVVGNCGFSPFGYKADTPYKSMLGSGLFRVGDAEGDFSSYWGWKEAVQKRVPLNIIPLQGHGSIRIGLCGYENRALTAEETVLYNEKLEEAFEQGVFGLSFGLMYEPDRYATRDELEQSAGIVAKHGGILTVHGRACSAASTSYSPPFVGRPHNLRALEEMIELSRRTGVRLQYSHMIYVGESTWRTVDESLRLIDEARREGLDISYDLYPMTFGVSVITVVLPNWFLSLPKEKRNSRLVRLRLAAEISLTKKVLGFSFEDMMAAWICDGKEELCNKRVSEIAAEWKVSPLDAYLRLVEMSEGKGRVNMYRYYNQQIITKLIQHGPSLFMTDAWIEGKGVQNAAAYTAYPRFLELSRNGKGVSLEETVRKMSGAAADRFKIIDRGYLHTGKAADITVFDAETVAAKGDLPERPVGIKHVFINGRHAVCEGVADEAILLESGSILRPEAV
ncbi:MAG: N-acyl-D-amino-acid deacylase family protein [Bacillota bacterium]